MFLVLNFVMGFSGSVVFWVLSGGCSRLVVLLLRGLMVCMIITLFNCVSL